MKPLKVKLNGTKVETFPEALESSDFKTVGGQSIVGSGDIEVGSVWGSITGTLSDQEDLNNALLTKADDSSVVHLTGNEEIGGTKTFGTIQLDNVNQNKSINFGTSGYNTYIRSATLSPSNDNSRDLGLYNQR